MTATLAMIRRHPIKAIGREALDSVALEPGGWMPYDRVWAVAHDRSKLAGGGWKKKVNFLRGVTDPSLMAVTSTLDEATGTITLDHPEAGGIAVDPEDGAAAFLDWLGRVWSPELPAPTGLYRAEGAHLSDVPDPWISIAALSSNAALRQRMDRTLSPERWRANLWLEGTPAWAEKGWVGREIAIGDVAFRVESEITRCKATMANPETGKRDADTLGALNALGHQEFGVYARVVKGGTLHVGDPVRVS